MVVRQGIQTFSWACLFHCLILSAVAESTITSPPQASNNDNKQRISFEWEPTLYQSGKLHRTMTIQKFLGLARCNWQLISVPPHKKEIVRQVFKHCQRHNGPEGYQSNFFKSYHKFLHKTWSNIFIICFALKSSDKLDNVDEFMFKQLRYSLDVSS